MKTYDVTLTETLKMTVPIEADSLDEAEQKAQDKKKNFKKAVCRCGFG